MAQKLVQFEVTGLNCAACAGRAQKALAAVPGVMQANVNLATRMAQISGSPDSTTLDEALQRAGYPAARDRIELAIEGMSCASCAGRVERALTAEPGVLSASVNIASNTASITVLSPMATPEQLARVVSGAGYPARPLSDDRTERSARAETAQAALRRDLIIAAALTLPVFLVEMGGHLAPGLHVLIHDSIGMQTSWLLQFLLITAVLLWPGRRFYSIGLRMLAKGAPDMNSLVALGTLAAWGYSTVALFLPSVLPDGTRVVYFEAAGVIVTLILLGRFLEARAKGRTGAAVRRLIGLRPATARVERDGTAQNIPIDAVKPGDVLQLRPGERIAVDGIVISGESYVEESMVTGEPAPVAKSEGATVIGGTVNGRGALRYRATAVGADTMLARIIAMVEQAQGAKLPIQALTDRVVLWFVPAIMAIAALTVLAWLLLGPAPVLTHALVAGVSVLIIACPCAMGLATPTSIMVGTGRAAELGVLFRKGDALQRLTDVRIVAFDKTGTLTEGRPALVRSEVLPGWEAASLLHLAASAESQSEHPIARALEQAAEAPLIAPDQVEAIAGHGLRAEVSGHTLLIGTRRLMRAEGIPTDALDPLHDDMAESGHSVVMVAVDGALAGIFSVADRVKPGARDTIAQLRSDGLRVAMITGDASASAHAIAVDLGIDDVRAEVLPGEKLEAVQALRRAHGPVAFVGDGINDAPALAEADVGIAVGSGTDVAIDSADVVLVSGETHGVVEAVAISRATMRNIRQNLGWAFGYNIALIPVAAGVLYPSLGMLLSPMIAAGAMALSSVFVLGNALRLRRISPASKIGETPIRPSQTALGERTA